MSDKNTLKTLGLALSQAAMAMGQGITGQPFLSNFQKVQLEREELARKQQAQDAFNKWVTGGGAMTPGGMGGVNPMGSISTNLNDNPQFVAVPNAQGSYDLQPNPLWKAQAEAELKAGVKEGEAQKKAMGNFGRVASAVKLYSDYYAKALDEGGAGGVIAKNKGKLFTGFLGGSQAEKMPETGKLFGQRAELSLSMVPILTNQNRFMTSIMDYINESLPQGQEGAKLAEAKLEQTLRNQYTTSRVLTKLGFDPDKPDEVSQLDQMGDMEAGGLAKKVIAMSKVYKLTPEEEKEYDLIKKDVLGSLTNYRGKNKSYKSLWE